VMEVLLQLSQYRNALEGLEDAHTRMPAKGRIAHALARLLASCPDVDLRDGQRALDLALRVYDARKTVTHAETVALALAESGRCDEALTWQRGAFEAARKAGAVELVEKFRIGLERYETQPCRPPAG